MECYRFLKMLLLGMLLRMMSRMLLVLTYISKLHLTNLEKQHVIWKPYKRNSPTWVFFKLN
jgi:hypothetical protein